MSNFSFMSNCSNGTLERLNGHIGIMCAAVWRRTPQYFSEEVNDSDDERPRQNISDDDNDNADKNLRPRDYHSYVVLDGDEEDGVGRKGALQPVSSLKQQRNYSMSSSSSSSSALKIPVFHSIIEGP